MSTLQRFAWIFALAGVLCGVTAGSYYFIFEDTDTTWSVLVVATGLLLSTYLFLDKDNVVQGVSTRSFRYSSGATALVVIAACLTVGLNIVASRKNHRWDWTEDKRYTLSEKTLSILGGLTDDVQVLAFFQPGDPKGEQFRHLADDMRPHSDHLKIDLIDPLRDPQKAEDYKLTSENGTVVLVVNTKTERLEQKFDETTFADALIRLTSGEDHKVCWMIGHGEADPDDDQARDGMGAAVVALENTNYTVAKRQPLVDGFATCSAVVIARPQVDYLPAEREAIAAYVAGGGRLFAMIEPNTVPNLAADFARYGVTIGNDLVIEQSPAAQMLDMPPTYLVLAEPSGSFAQHPITDKLHSMVVLGIARSVSAIPGEGRKTTEIAQTSDQAWAETDLDPSTPKGPDPGERQGRIPVAVAVEITDPLTIQVMAPKVGDAAVTPVAPVAPEAGDTDMPEAPKPSVTIGGLDAGDLSTADASRGVPADFVPKAGGRVVVIGDSDFAGNQLMGLGNSKDLFVNSLAWLVDEKSQLGESAADPDKQRVTMTVVGGAVLLLGSLIFVPGAAVAMGAAVMLRRRFL